MNRDAQMRSVAIQEKTIRFAIGSMRRTLRLERLLAQVDSHGCGVHVLDRPSHLALSYEREGPELVQHASVVGDVGKRLGHLPGQFDRGCLAVPSRKIDAAVAAVVAFRAGDVARLAAGSRGWRSSAARTTRAVRGR